MSLDEIRKDLGGLLGDVALWVICLKSPMRTALSILESGEAEESKLVRALRIWLVAFLVSLVIQMPIYKSAGIAWDDVAFHLPVALYQLFILLAGGAAAHVALRFSGVRSDLTETMILNIVVVGAYTPIIILANYPLTLKFIGAIMLVKPMDLSFADAVGAVLNETAGIRESLGDAIVLGLSPVLTFVSMLVLTSYARALSVWYACPHGQALRAFAFALGVIMPPVIAGLLLFFGYVIYVFAPVG